LAHLAAVKADKIGLGGFNTDGIEWGHVGDHIKELVQSRLHYHDIWRLLSRPSAQSSGGWDSANGWALQKLQDYHRWPERELIYTPGRVKIIEKETGKFLFHLIKYG